jgi:diguanylate cyclase (GGDEF)-like protein
VLYEEMLERAEHGDRDLRLVHFENSLRLDTERVVGMIATKSRRLIEEARQQANHCALTGLYNRLYFDIQLPREIERTRTWCRPLTIAVVDIDNFKLFNTVYGMPTADRVLRTFGAVAKAGLRSSDWVARYGGDEFLFVMPGTTLDAARQVIERIGDAFRAERIESLDGRIVTATISAGVVELGPEPVTAEQLVDQASRTLNRAKEKGRNRIELATG